MRRSLMVNQIAAILDYLNKFHSGNEYEKADYLLDKLELEGMLPPEITVGDPYWIRNSGWEDNVANIWEPEDEEK